MHYEGNGKRTMKIREEVEEDKVAIPKSYST
jgi:hypothetical protein